MLYLIQIRLSKSVLSIASHKWAKDIKTFYSVFRLQLHTQSLWKDTHSSPVFILLVKSLFSARFTKHQLSCRPNLAPCTMHVWLHWQSLSPTPVQPQTTAVKLSENCPQLSCCHHCDCVLTKLRPYMVLTRFKSNTKGPFPPTGTSSAQLNSTLFL